MEIGTNHRQRLIALLEDDSWYPGDVTFVVGPNNEEVKGHRFVLMVHSAVLRQRILYNNNGVFPVIGIQDGNAKDFKLFLRFLYTGEFPNPTEVSSVLKYAVEFKVLDLEEWCWKTLAQMTAKSVFSVYQLGKQYRKDDLCDQALQFILSNANTFLDSDEFLEFTPDILLIIFASDDLAARNETQVFNAVLRWGKDMCKIGGVEPTGSALRILLTDLLPMVRFPVMNKHDFSVLVPPLKILTDNELISILLYFNIDKDNLNDIPPGEFNRKERTWFKEQKTAQEHVLHRLVPVPDDPDLRSQLVLEHFERTFQNLTVEDHADPIHRLRFSVDHPIWITSVGVNAGTEYVSYHDDTDSEIEFVVAIENAAAENELACGIKVGTPDVDQLDKTFQLHFSKPCQVEPGVWYTLRFYIDDGAYKPNLYLSPMGCDGRNKSITVEGKTINFLFEEVPGQNPAVIGLTQGFIPTIGFKLDGPKAQQ